MRRLRLYMVCAEPNGATIHTGRCLAEATKVLSTPLSPTFRGDCLRTKAEHRVAKPLVQRGRLRFSQVLSYKTLQAINPLAYRT